MQKFLLFLALSSFIACKSDTTPVSGVPQLGKSSIKEVINAMTIEEKANLVTGMGFFIPGMPDNMLPPVSEEDKKTPEKVVGAAGRTHAIPRLGIPSITLSDGPAGVRIQPIRNNDNSKTYYATAFPIATLLASSWDTALVHELGTAFGSEVRDYGIDVLLAPAMNIHRNSLGGRNFEYFSEDPVLSGHISAAIVNGVQSNGVGTSIKHFAANNNEFNRMAMDVQVNERTLREIYLKNFQITLQNCNPWTVMSSYNMINGTYTSENKALLDTVLRQEFGFKGMVMTDWYGGKNAAAQVNAGNDLLMPGSVTQKTAVLEALKNNTLSMAQLDANVERILNLIIKTPTFLKYKYSDAPDLKKNAEVSRKAATEGMVLLKNEGALPFAPAKKIALFGNVAYELIAGGTGSGDVNKAYMISLDKGLTNANYTLDGSLTDAYKQYAPAEKAKLPKPKTPFDPKVAIPEMPIDAALAQKLSTETDVAVVTFGKHSGEFIDRSVGVDFNLTAAEKAMLAAVSKSFHAKGKKVVVVLNVGGVVETASWRDNADAILLAWQAGQESGNAIADILSGAVNPSGKLPSTFPMSNMDESSSKNFPGKERTTTDYKPTGLLLESKPAEITYGEGVYVGYRYFGSFDVKTAYPFGYGLSYTKFSYSDVKLSAPKFNDKITATVTITNTGKKAGKEAVQFYLTSPAKQLDKPKNELKAFAKTKLLQPNESETITFTLNANDLASFDAATSAWVAEAGNYTVRASSVSTDMAHKATFSLDKALQLEKVHKVLVPKMVIKDLKK
jgi:beta-glucosidase